MFQQIDAMVSEIRDIAASLTGNLTPTAEESHQSIANIAAGGFGTYPGADALGDRHSAVKQVFIDITEDLIADLEQLAAGVNASMDEYENADDASAALSQSLLAVLGQPVDRHTRHDIESYTDQYVDALTDTTDDAPQPPPHTDH